MLSQKIEVTQKIFWQEEELGYQLQTTQNSIVLPNWETWEMKPPMSTLSRILKIKFIGKI